MVASPSSLPSSPISKGNTQDAIRIFSDLANSDDPETLRSVGEGLAKVARKGWQSAIDAEHGVEICMRLIQHTSPRVHTKGLALLNPLSADEQCRPGLIEQHAVQVAWSFCVDPTCEAKADYTAECWREALQALCNFGCGDAGCVAAVVAAEGIGALAANICSALQSEVVSALQNISKESDNHAEILGTPALTHLVGILNDESKDSALKASSAATIANLAANTACHGEFELAGVTAVLLATVADQDELLRRHLARALANLCVVMSNQRNILIYKYLWNTYAVLGCSVHPEDQEVAVNFYLYVSENEALAEILQYTDVPVMEHVIYPLVALGYSDECADRAAVALGKLAPPLRVSLTQADEAISLLVVWLEKGSSVCQSEAIRTLTTLTSGNDQKSTDVLYIAIQNGLVPTLSVLAACNDDVVAQCSAVKLLSAICKQQELHAGAIEVGILDHLLALARLNDFVAKAEAINSLGNLFQNTSVHAALVNSGGLIVALEMAESGDGMLSARGMTLFSALCNSTDAHLAIVNAGCLALFSRLAREASETIRGVIAQAFSALATNLECCEAMCKDDHVTVLGTMAEDREHLLSSASLRLLIAMAERFYKDGKSGFATQALADLAADEACCAEMLEHDGFARLSALAGCTDANIRRETSRLLAHFMDHAESA